MTILAINFCLYLIYTIYGFCKCKYLTVHNAVSLWFTIIAFMGWITVRFNIYQAVFGVIHINEFEPYLYCYICFLFLILPLKKLNYKHITLCRFNDIKETKFKRYALIPIIVLLIYIISLIPDVIIALSTENISDVYYEQRVEGTNLYNHGVLVNLIFSIGRKFYNWFWAIFAFFSIYIINKNSHGKNQYYILLFLIALLPYFLRTIQSGGRGGFLFFSIQIAILILPLWSTLNKNFKKKILILSLSCIGLFMVYLVTMTIARVEISASETPLTSVLRYFGEPYPNLGNNLWGHIKNHLMGRRMFPELFGFDETLSGLSQYEKFSLWQSYCGVAVLNYKTIFGDFYLEFGTIPAICIIATMGLLMNQYLKKKVLYFHQLPLYAYYITICSTAPLWFNQRNTGDILVVIQCLIVAYLIKRFLYEKVKGRNYNNP